MPASIRVLCVLFSVFATAKVGAEAPVRVETVSSRTIVQHLNVSGSVTSPRSAVLSTAVAGLVAELTVDDRSLQWVASSGRRSGTSSRL